MNDNRYKQICRLYKIEKRRNSPDIIYFQHYEIDGFFAPKYIYVAFSIDSKTEYKAQSREDLAEWIDNNKEIKLQFNNKELEYLWYS